jgi:hypothetical protein
MKIDFHVYKPNELDKKPKMELASFKASWALYG